MSTQTAHGQPSETITVIGATGLIGTMLVAELRARGHRVIAASRRSGVDTFDGAGVDAAVSQASVVVDVTNPGDDVSTDPVAFFTRSTRNLLTAEARFGVRHHVVLSIVGTDRLVEAADRALIGAGYFHGKQAQEDLVRSSQIPFTILRATQFFEFLAVIAEASTDAGTVRVPPAWLQPVAAADVARAVADTAVSAPVNGTLEVAGPARLSLEEVVSLALGKLNDSRRVVADPAATYFGVPVEQDTLMPGSTSKLGVVTLHAWLDSAREPRAPTTPDPADDHAARRSLFPPG